MPHELYEEKFVEAQVDIARNIQEILKIYRLQGDDDLSIKPLTDETKVRRFFGKLEQVDKTSPQGNQVEEQKE